MAKPMAKPIDTRASIDSHTNTEFGRYDAEPFAVGGNAYYWYIRAVYWKREANRKEGVQTTMEFVETSKQKVGGEIVLSAADLKVVKSYLNDYQDGSGNFGGKINAIKHVRIVTMCGLKEAKDYVEKLYLTSPPPLCILNTGVESV